VELMKITHITRTIEAELKRMYGSNRKAAAALGITYRRYCQIRQGRVADRQLKPKMIDRVKLALGVEST
jgi:hypothetical protein